MAGGFFFHEHASFSNVLQENKRVDQYTVASRKKKTIGEGDVAKEGI